MIIAPSTSESDPHFHHLSSADRTETTDDDDGLPPGNAMQRTLTLWSPLLLLLVLLLSGPKPFESSTYIVICCPAGSI